MIKKQSLFAGIFMMSAGVIVLLSVSTKGIFAANVTLPTHSFEGSTERISLELSKVPSEPVYLEVYEFHYVRHPELAPEEDTWFHNKQMNFMFEVLMDRAEPFKPSLDDEKMQKILEISPKRTIELKTGNGRLFYTDWVAKHGRIFFRVKIGDEYLEDVYTTRVHCRHIDMRTVEQLKDLLESIRLPLEHKNSMFAQQLLDQIYSSYTEGHSLQFMLKHHEESTQETDLLFDKLKDSLGESDLEAGKKLVDEILGEISQKEEVFFSLEGLKNGNFIAVKVRDNINNDYSFFADEKAEVYIREYRKPTIEELMKKLHSMPQDHSKMDPSMHMESLKPDKNKLTQNTIELQNKGDSFSGSIPTEWRSIRVIVIYGNEQSYYLTKNIKL